MEKNYRQLIEVGCGIAKDQSSFSAGLNAAKQAMTEIHTHSISMVLIFTSVVYNLNETLQGVRSITGKAPLFGATTAGEIYNGMQQETVTVTIIASPFLRVHYGLGKNVSKDWRQALDEALRSPRLKSLLKHSSYLHEMRQKGKDAFVILFSPGNTSQADSHSFELLEKLKLSPIGNLPVFGGCAADDWRMAKNYVLYGDKAYSDSLIVVVVETELQFGISLTHGFRPTDRHAMVTAIDGNEILSLDGTTAKDAYCSLLGLSKGDSLESYLTYTTGATIGISGSMEEYSVNLASYFTPRGGLRLTCPVAVGTVLTRMEPDPERMLLAGREAVRRAVIQGGITDAAIGIVSYCALRPRILGDKSQAEIAIMQDMLAGKPLVGFCSLGEQGVGVDGVSRNNSSALACLVLGSQMSKTAHIAFENDKLMKEVRAQQELLLKANAALLREVFERKRIEHALRESEKKLTDFAQAVPDISAIIDEDGRYVELFTQVDDKNLPRPKTELVELTIHEIFSEPNASNMLKQVQHTILSGAPQSCVYEIEMRDTKQFYEIRMAPMSYLSGNKKTVAAVATDITEQRIVQQRLQLAYELRRRSDFLNDIIMGNTIVDEKSLLIAKILGVDLSIPIVCCLLDFQQAESSDLSLLKSKLLERLSDEPDYVIWGCRNGLGVLLQAKDANWNHCLQLVALLKDKLSSYAPEHSVIVAVSDMHTGADSIKNSFQQALSAATTARCQSESSSGIYLFRDLGIYQLLAGLGDKEQSHTYIEATIGNLIAYDRDKGSDLLLTLEVILQCANLKQAAEKLYLHPKSLVFRRQRIEKILGLSIEPFETRLALAAAIKLHKLRHSNSV